jgi:hypothetical protein
MKKTLEKFVVSPTQKLSVGEQKALKGKLGPPYSGVKIPNPDQEY